MVDKDRSSSEVYIWATGQDDNIGDSLLRRAYISELRAHGRVVVWVGESSQQFIAGLGLSESDRIIGNYFRWFAHALIAGIRRPTLVAVNAGEVPISRRGAFRMMTLAFLLGPLRMRGGRGVWVGAGIPVRSANRYLVRPYSLVAGQCTYVRFRDPESVSLVADSVEVEPDWAFSLGTPIEHWSTPSSRAHLALVMRGDRARPSAEWITWVKQISEALNLKPIVVVQVKRDNEMAEWLGRELDCVVSVWDDSDHSRREATVRRIYAESRVVVGDRLHGLIVAATEGAVPIGWVESATGKIQRHFGVIGLEWVGKCEGSPAADYEVLSESALSSMVNQLEVAVAEARIRLDRVGNEMRESTA
ncbi:polysaccharide pyruvyl transferase family protein [Rhodococcus sp. NPDC003318]|uniref:polysaccharide pyruvyl transferase family protein n=1 Tax=Rhodococcus sp. NPDC003318 TaxID=3364503 RepID=UPI0036C48367